MPATSQLDWLISMTAMIVLFWSRATRDLLKSFGWGIAGTPSIRCTRRSGHYLSARPIASLGPPWEGHRFPKLRQSTSPGLGQIYVSDYFWPGARVDDVI